MSRDPLVHLVGLALTRERDIDRESRPRNRADGPLDRADHVKLRGLAGRIVQRHGDDQALALPGDRKPGRGRLPDIGNGPERGPHLGEQRSRVGGRPAHPDLATVVVIGQGHRVRGQVIHAVRVDGDAGLRPRVQRDAHSGGQQPGQISRRDDDVRSGLRRSFARPGPSVFLRQARGGNRSPAERTAGPVPGRQFARGGERGDEFGPPVGHGRERHGRAVGDRALVIGQREPEPAPAKLVEQVGHPGRVLRGGRQRVLDRGGRGEVPRVGARLRGIGRAMVSPGDGVRPHDGVAMRGA